MKGKCVQMKGRWEDMNAHWNENERNMKGKWMEMNTNERNMKGRCMKMKENACEWMQHKRNMKCCRSTWNQQNNCSIHFRACLGMDFGFMLDLEYVDFHKTLETDRPPPKKSDNHIWHNNSNYSNVKDFDGSYIYILDSYYQNDIAIYDHILYIIINIYIYIYMWIIYIYI